MKIRLNHWYSAILASLISLLGFESCDSTGTEEYGTPIVSYQVKGNVKGDTGSDLRGIQVTIKSRNYRETQGRDTAYTDANGNFEMKKLKTYGESYLKNELVVTFEDVDGEANGGTFEKDSLKGMQVTIVQKKKGEHWYGGDFEVTADKKLKKQKK